MTHFYTTILSLFLFVGQTIDGFAQSNFHKAYGTLNADKGYFVDQLGSAKYFVAGNSTGSGWGGYNAVVMYLDMYGDTIWTRHLGNQYHEFFIDAAVSLSTGELLVVTEELSGFTPENDMRVTSIDIFGNVSWSQVYASWSDKYAEAICATSDGGFVITGTSDSVVADTNGIFLLKCNATGSPQWFKKYTGPQLYAIGYDICETLGGGFLVAGKLFSNNSNTKTIVLRTDMLGTVMWCRVIDLGLNVDEPRIAEEQNTTILLSGFVFGTSGGGYNYVAGLTTGGNVSWLKSYVPVTDEHYRMTDAALSTSTGGLTMCGFHSSPSLTSSYILRVSSTGVLQSSLLYASNGHDTYLRGIDISNDGGVALVGQTGGVSSPNDSAGIVLIKSLLYNNSVCGQTSIGMTVSNPSYTTPFASAVAVSASWYGLADTIAVQSGLQVYNGCAVGIDEAVNSQMAIFPNPVFSTFRIDYPAQAGDVIVVRNALSEVVQRTTAGYAEISLEHLTSGIYCCEIVRDGEVMAVRKLIKE